MAGGYATPNSDTIDVLLERFTTLEGRVRELERPTGTQVAESVKELEAQLANQVLPQVGASSNYSFTVTGSFATITSFNLVVPAGYTRAAITAAGAISVGSTANDRFDLRTVVAGIAGPFTIGFNYAAAGEVSFSAFGSYTLSGLTPGSNILVELQSKHTTGTISGLLSSSITAMALFQK